MESTPPRPLVGIGVMILKDGKILLHQRKGSHGAGEWAFPGGHLEHMESFEECARRETTEEVGIEIQNIQFQCIANIRSYAPKHYVYIGFTADWKSGEPKTMEPEKSASDWAWYNIDNLPTPLFKTITIHIDSHKTGKTYYDA